MNEPLAANVLDCSGVSASNVAGSEVHRKVDVNEEYIELARHELSRYITNEEYRRTQAKWVRDIKSLFGEMDMPQSEEERWRWHESVVDGGFSGCEFPRLWPPVDWKGFM